MENLTSPRDSELKDYCFFDAEFGRKDSSFAEE